MMAKRPSNKSHHRTAFTLIELLVVISILSILMSLLLPAINGVRRRARVAQVKTEINTLESAIASFKAEFGIEPPGSIRLFSTSAGWNTTGSTTADETIRVKSRAYIRQLWPQFDFTMGDSSGGLGGAGTAYPYYWSVTPASSTAHRSISNCRWSRSRDGRSMSA